MNYLTRLGCLRGGVASRMEHDFDAAVLLVAERLVHRRPLLQPDPMGDDEGGVDLAFLDAVQEIVGPAIDMGLAGADGQTLVHQRAERNLVEESAIDARY